MAGEKFDTVIIDGANDHRKKLEEATQREFRVMELGKRIHLAVKQVDNRELYSEAENDLVIAQNSVNELQEIVDELRDKLIKGS